MKPRCSASERGHGNSVEASARQRTHRVRSQSASWRSAPRKSQSRNTTRSSTAPASREPRRELRANVVSAQLTERASTPVKSQPSQREFVQRAPRRSAAKKLESKISTESQEVSPRWAFSSCTRSKWDRFAPPPVNSTPRRSLSRSFSSFMKYSRDTAHCERGALLPSPGTCRQRPSRNSR
jgi:hypothetical protein